METPKPSALAPVWSALRLRCPRCGTGKLFSGWVQMCTNCDTCGFKFEREPGFYLGSVYINYGAGSLIAGVSYVALAFGFGLPQREVLFGCLAFTLIFPVWFHRYARSIFLAIDYTIHPEGEPGAAKPKGNGNSDDATAGIVLGVVLVLTILFGIVMTGVAVVVGMKGIR